MINEEIRSYEVSVWTLQDEFITVLKWSNVENKGTIQEPKMTIPDDGIQSFTFTIPMYLYENGKLFENPIWYNTRNGNLMVSMRKIKVIFNKESYYSMTGMGDSSLGQGEQVFEFLITKITEEHEQDHLLCKVECEGLAFHELGKVGYIYDLSQSDIEYDYEDFQTKGYWTRRDGTKIYSMPKSTVDYWCQKIALDPYPTNTALVNPRKWYYKVEMDWSSFSDQFQRDSSKVYENEHATSWTYNESKNDLEPTAVARSREKERIIEVKDSNVYNITQTICENFEIFCRYEYGHDANYRITSRTVVFFNNYIHDNNQDIMSLTYPYSSSKISREMDSSNIVTKLYIKSMEDSTTYLGEASIRYCDANKMQEDYIFNFEYMKEVGAINNDQYEAIKQYEIDMHNYNTTLYPLEQKIAYYQNKINELSAKQTIYENSIELDKEQYDNNSDLAANLLENNSSNPSGGYIDARNELNPDVSIISTDDKGNYCIKLGTKEKGIHTDSVRIYRSYSSSNHTFGSGSEVTGFTFAYDEYNNPTTIYGIAPDSDPNASQPNMVYMTYEFEPKLYYDSIAKTWLEKLAVDETHYSEVTEEIEALQTELSTVKDQYDLLLQDKQKTEAKFNAMMGPAIREGYWQPEDYQDYGEYHEQVHNFENQYNQSGTYMTSDLGSNFSVGWDTELFDEEQDIYYESSILQKKIYYPCINLTNFLSNSDFINNLKESSFVFNNHYYNPSADLSDFTNIRSFSIGSEAILGFVKNSKNNIYPALILVGAKNMTTAHNPWKNGDEYPKVDGGTIGFMKNPNRGHPRISKLTSTISGSNVTVSETNILPDSNGLTASYFTFGGDEIEDCTVIFPRIRFTSLMLKTDSSNLFIRYPYVQNVSSDALTNIADYYIRNRRNATTYTPEYLITLKAETMIKSGVLNGNVRVNYALSNASTAIYLDALEIEKENAYPKVSYTIDTNVLNKQVVSTLYNKLNWLVMINDVQLKFENVFGYISKLELDLDKPENDSIEVKNYKTKFEDLFSSIVATTEELKSSSSKLSSAAYGEVALSSEGFSETIINNYSILDAYLDSYFDGSEVVIEKLTELFDELGSILGDSNKTLTQMNAISTKNASILSGFAQEVQKELTVKVTTSSTKPDTFKPGDIWIQTDPNDPSNIIGRYVATYLSSEIDNDRSGIGGFVRTYDGTLASITGAGMEVDAENGKVDIYAQNELTLRSGNHIYIGANDAVDIIGNKSVNIGGTTINIAADASDNTTIGGINLVSAAINMSAYKNQPNKDSFSNWAVGHDYAAGDFVYFNNTYYRCTTAHTSSTPFNTSYWTQYLTIEDAIAAAIASADTSISKVLINSNKIELGSADILMRGADKIQMITSRGTPTNTSAIEISPETGVWIGSGQGVRLFSGTVSYTTDSNGDLIRGSDFQTNGASVELNSEHLILGFANTKNNSATAIEMTDQFVIIAAGNQLSGDQTTDAAKAVTGTSDSLIGAKFTKDSIGFATGSGANIQGFLINNNGITLGSGSIDVTLPTTGNNGNNLRSTSGSYVRISYSGIELGSLADLYVNMNNFKLQTDILTGDSEPTTRLAIGRNLQNIDSTTTSGLGSSFIGLVYNKTGLFVNGVVNASAFVASCNKGYFKATGDNLGFYNTSNTAVMTLSGTTMTIANGYTLSVGGGLSITSTGNLDISADNIVINSDASGSEVAFKLRKKNNSNYTDYLTYTADGNLTLKVASLTLGTDTTAVTSSADLTMSPSEIWQGVTDYANGTNTALQITGSSIVMKASAGSSTTNFTLNTEGIEMNGKNITITAGHLMVNGQTEWSRDDIKFGPNQPTAPSDGRAWIWIKPMGNSTLSYSGVGNGTANNTYRYVDKQIFTTASNFFATASEVQYTYSISGSLYLAQNETNTIYIYAWIWSDNDQVPKYIGVSSATPSYISNSRSSTVPFSMSEKVLGRNFCASNSTHIIIKVGLQNWNDMSDGDYTWTNNNDQSYQLKTGTQIVIESMTLNASCPVDSTGTRAIPCDVYYFNPTA